LGHSHPFGWSQWLLDVAGDRLTVADDLTLCLGQADQVSESIKTSIDGFMPRSAHDYMTDAALPFESNTLARSCFSK
jgi:hypothetical protein